jgi:four helix bundle protein
MSHVERVRRRVERFEDLIAWQKARELARTIYTLTKTSPLAKDFALSSQLQRASVSIMSNVAEGFERGSAADFHRFVTMAKASCAELRSQLYLALDVGYIEESEFTRIMNMADEVAKILGGLKASLANRKVE